MRQKKDLVKFEKQFDEILTFMRKARMDVWKKINKELIDLYWKIGEYISNKIQNAEWGEGIVKELAGYISRKDPDVKGYSDKNLWRMRQFYEVYYSEKKLSALLRQLSWTNNVLILSKCKSNGEREFYQLTIEKNLQSN